ncbi:MAG: HlyD family efflux transporter periplasmic adaptor subunit [Emticicia sp.]|uniref:HlyD family efflux transporter periplasmic adaptor subunit n=1 Tax=Emticicia sp. TaxID=1930953 RepID=UPI003BA48789
MPNEIQPSGPSPVRVLNMPRRSEEVDEILSEMPSWTLRWGLTVIFGIVATILILSYFVKYPDVIKGKINITSNNPPVPLVTRTSGNIVLIVPDKSIVKEDEVLGYLKSATKFNDFLKLKQKLNFIKSSSTNSFNPDSLRQFTDDLQLGELQVPYNNFLLKIKEIGSLNIRQQNTGLRKLSINQQIEEYSQISERLKRQVQLLESEYNLQKKNYENRYKALHKAGSISTEQLEQKQDEVFQKLKAVEAAKSSYDENQNRIITLQSQKIEVDFEQKDRQLNSNNLLLDAYTNLLNQLNIWEQTYLLKATIGGKVNYLSFIKQNSYINENQEVANIIPPTANTNASLSSSYVGELFLEASGSGKIAEGQDVNIILDNFSKKEFGILKGKVASIADVSSTITSNSGSQSVYKVYVNLPNGLTTSSKKKLSFRHGMQGNAEVITKDISILGRIFDTIRAAFEQ